MDKNGAKCPVSGLEVRSPIVAHNDGSSLRGFDAVGIAMHRVRYIARGTLPITGSVCEGSLLALSLGPEERN